MKKKIVDSFFEITRNFMDSIGNILDEWHTSAALQKQATDNQKQQICKLSDSFIIQRDISRALEGMSTPTGLMNHSDPRNLTYLPDYCTDARTFAFFWQKSAKGFTFNEESRVRLLKRINQRIRQLLAYLISIGYTEENLFTEYPALYNGIEVADIRNDVDGLIIIVRCK